MPRILVVEDDLSIGRGLAAALEAAGYEARWVETGAAALGAVGEFQPELVLLDLGLPDIDGIDLCRRLRASGVTATIVALTARAEEMDVVVGLDAGADDYLTKPFRLAELLARVRAHLRRSDGPEAWGLNVDDVRLDLGARRCWVGESEVDLRAREFDLLALLMAEAGRVVPRERIMSEVWDEHWFGSTKTLDMHISALRRKLGAREVGTARITTLRGVGYRMEP